MKGVTRCRRRSPNQEFNFFLFCASSVYFASLRSVVDGSSITFEEMTILCLLSLEKQCFDNIDSSLKRVNAILLNNSYLSSEDIRTAVDGLRDKRYITVIKNQKAQIKPEGTAIINSIFSDFFKVFQHFTKESAENIFPENPEIH